MPGTLSFYSPNYQKAKVRHHRQAVNNRCRHRRLCQRKTDSDTFLAVGIYLLCFSALHQVLISGQTRCRRWRLVASLFPILKSVFKNTSWVRSCTCCRWSIIRIGTQGLVNLSQELHLPLFEALCGHVRNRLQLTSQPRAHEHQVNSCIWFELVAILGQHVCDILPVSFGCA